MTVDSGMSMHDAECAGSQFEGPGSGAKDVDTAVTWRVTKTGLDISVYVQPVATICATS